MGRRQLHPDRCCAKTCWKVQHSALFVQKLSRYKDFHPDATLLKDCCEAHGRAETAVKTLSF